MKRKNTTRNALFTSIISMLLCVSMLVGTTFAWFTDSVVSGNNVIAAGNLDVELYHGKTAEPTDKVDGSDRLFTDFNGNLIEYWEPGVVAYTNLKVANVGSLALKYQMAINFSNMNYVDYGNGNRYTLADVLKVAVVEGGFTGDRTAAHSLSYNYTLSSFGLSGVLEADETTKTYGVVIFWEPSNDEFDNLFNMNNGKTTSDGNPLRVDLGINLFATQEMYEEDSFGTDYDKGAAWTGLTNTEWYNTTDSEFTLTSAEELAGLAQIVNSGTDSFMGKTVKLGANVDLNDAAWTPIGNSSNKFQGTFIGTGYTISNLFVTGTKGVGLFGYTFTGAHIEGVTIDGANVSGNDYVGAILGSGYLAKNCLKNNTVKNATITATPYLKADGVTYDGGAKAGAVAGYANNGNITGNTAINCTVSAYRDLGGIVGMASGEDYAIEVSGNTVDTVILTYLDLNGAAYDGNKVNENMGNTVGRPSNANVANNTEKDVTRKTVITWIINGVQYTKDIDTGVVTLFKITDAFTGDSLTVPAGVTALYNKSLNGNTTIKEVTIPSGLTDFGGTANATGTGASGGFFYGSAVEKVVLPEGLTVIPDAAFNGAKNLKEVNIPSTVTDIGINAFAYTGLTELTVPATVKNIGYGAFRGMENLTTVTIEGDSVHIPDYTFRACPKLTAVTLNVNTLTLDSGNMAFTNTGTNNENPNNITIYVTNDSVYDTLTNNSYVKCTVVKGNIISSAAQLVALGGTKINGTYVLAADLDMTGYDMKPMEISGGANVTFVGNGHTISNLNLGAANIHGMTGSGNEVAGLFDMTAPATTVSLTVSDLTISNATVSCNGYAAAVVGYNSNSGSVVTLKNVDVMSADVSAETVAALVGYTTGAVNLTDCDVSNLSLTGEVGRPEKVGAYVGTANTATCTVTVDNCTNNTAYNYAGRVIGSAAMTIDGVAYVTNADGLANVVANGATNILLADGEYNVKNCGGKKLTISGSKKAVIKIYNEAEDGCDYGFDSSTVIFNGITIDTSANTGNYKGFARLTATFNNCAIKGAYTTHMVQTFNNCTFNTNNGYIWIWGAEKVTFNGCTFEGNSKAILAHGGASTVININNCDFVATEKGYTGAGDNTAAIEIDPTGTNTYTINFTGKNTITDSYAGWTRVKDGSTGHITTEPVKVNSAAGLEDALNKGDNIELSDDLTISTKDTSSNSGYGATGITVNNGDVFDGNGNTFTVNNANGGWDCAVNPQNGTVQNMTVEGAFRGIFMSGASGDVYIDNVIVKDVVYTFNSDGGNKNYGVYISNSELYGWTSFSDVHKEVVFTNCTFGEGNGYAFCRPYNAPSVFKNCVFEEGFEFDTSKTSAITFENCYYGDTLITAENAATLGNGDTTFFYNGLNGITIK